MTALQRWLLVALAAQIALILLLRAPFGDDGGPRQTRPLLPGVADATPARIELTGEDGSELVLARDGDRWTIPALDGFPVDGSQVDQLLQDLAAFRIRRPVVASARYHKAFRVADDDHVARVRLLDAEGKALADVLFGTSPAFRTVHVRRADEDAVYEVADFATHEVRPDTSVWIDRQLISVPVDEIESVAIERPGASIRLIRGEEGWTVALDGAAPVPADDDNARRVVETAADLRIADAAGARDDAAMGLDRPSVRVEIARAGGETVAFRLGGAAPEPEGRRYAAVDGSPFAGIVWESTLAPLMTLPAEDLPAREAPTDPADG